MLGTIAGSSVSEIALRQKRAKRFDFRRYEIGEGPHSGSVLHVAVHEQVVGQCEPYIIDDAHNLTLAIPLPMRHCHEPGAGLECKQHSCQWSLRVVMVAWGASDRSRRGPG